MSSKLRILMLSAFCLFVCIAFAQDRPQDSSKKVVQHVAITETSATSGKEMFTSYCAVCHGADAKGNGPAASALKTPPSNLTFLSKENGGKFPSMKVTSTIRGTGGLPAHGSRDMPMWGDLFWSMSHGQEGQVQQRVSNLTHYLESLQQN